MELTPEEMAARESAANQGGASEAPEQTKEKAREEALEYLRQGLLDGYKDISSVAGGDSGANERDVKRAGEMLEKPFVKELAKVMGGEFGELVGGELGDVEITPERESALKELVTRLVDSFADTDSHARVMIAETGTYMHTQEPDWEDPVVKLMFGRAEGDGSFSPSAARTLLRIFHPGEPKMDETNRGLSRSAKPAPNGRQMSIVWTGYGGGGQKHELMVGPYMGKYHLR